MKLAISSLVIGFSLISSAVNAEKSSSEGAVYDAAIKANEALELVHNASKEAGILELNDCSGSCNNHPNWDSTAGYYFVYVNGTKVYVRGGSPLRMGTPIYKNEGADKTFFTELAGLSKEQYNSGLTFHLPGAPNYFIDNTFDDIADRESKIVNEGVGCFIAYKPSPDAQFYPVTDDCLSDEDYIIPNSDILNTSIIERNFRDQFNVKDILAISNENYFSLVNKTPRLIKNPVVVIEGDKFLVETELPPFSQVDVKFSDITSEDSVIFFEQYPFAKLTALYPEYPDPNHKRKGLTEDLSENMNDKIVKHAIADNSFGVFELFENYMFSTHQKHNYPIQTDKDYGIESFNKYLNKEITPQKIYYTQGGCCGQAFTIGFSIWESGINSQNFITTFTHEKLHNYSFNHASGMTYGWSEYLRDYLKTNYDFVTMDKAESKPFVYSIYHNGNNHEYLLANLGDNSDDQFSEFIITSSSHHIDSVGIVTDGTYQEFEPSINVNDKWLRFKSDELVLDTYSLSQLNKHQGDKLYVSLGERISSLNSHGETSISIAGRTYNGEDIVISDTTLSDIDKHNDIALNKPASMSSQYSSRYPASNAVDGSSETMNHTNNGPNEWLEVDLLDSYNIDYIYIENRPGFAGRLDGADLILLDENRNVLKAYSLPKNSQYYVYDIPSNVRYITIENSGIIHVQQIKALIVD